MGARLFWSAAYYRTFYGDAICKDVPVARFIGTTWMVLGLYGAIFTGFVGFAYVASADASIFSAQGIEVIMEDGIQVLADEETIFIVFAQVLFHPLVAG